ncbi:MAG: condensation domain-containing protein [Bacteroidota bacterium]
MKYQDSRNASLSKELTSALLKEANKAYDTEIDDLLLAALALTIQEWSQMEQVVIGMEGHGREDLFPELNTTRTVGWFTSMYPILLEATANLSERDVIRSVKERMRSIPGKGMGYGLLRYLHESAEVRESLSKGKWDIIFNYLGQMDTAVPSDEEDAAYDNADEGTGREESDNLPFATKLEFVSLISDGQLSLSITYSTEQYEASTIERIAEQYFVHLGRLIEHCQKAKDAGPAPSDFGLIGKISYKEMENFLDQNTNEEDDDDLIMTF